MLSLGKSNLNFKLLILSLKPHLADTIKTHKIQIKGCFI